MSNFGRMNRLDPSLFFQDTADINPSYQRTNNSYIKLIYNHEDYNSTRTLQLIRDYSINPDIIHYRYSPLTRRELLGIFHALQPEDLLRVIRTSSPEFQKDPFRIGPKSFENMSSRVLRQQPELLQPPIVFNSITNDAIVAIPPERVLNFLQIDQFQPGQDLPQNLILKMQSDISRDENNDSDAIQLDGIANPIFPTPNNILSQITASSQNISKTLKEQVQQRNAQDNATQPNEEDFMAQSHRFKEMYDSIRTSQGITNENEKQLLEENMNGNIRSAPIAYNGNGGFMRVSNEQIQNRKQWLAEQEEKFGKRDANSFIRWRREKQHMDRLKRLEEESKALKV